MLDYLNKVKGISEQDREKINKAIDKQRNKIATLHQENELLKRRWNAIETLPVDSIQVLAFCKPCDEFPEGRMMIWDSQILRSHITEKVPSHLNFPATHWMKLPEYPLPKAS